MVCTWLHKCLPSFIIIAVIIIFVTVIIITIIIIIIIIIIISFAWKAKHFAFICFLRGDFSRISGNLEQKNILQTSRQLFYRQLLLFNYLLL